MKQGSSVAVYGANGHTGRFVMAALERRGIPAIAVGRDADKLKEAPPSADIHVANLDDAASLKAAFQGAAVVINCAGPFLDTAEPVARAALAAGAHCIDVAPEQVAVQAMFDHLQEPAVTAGRAIVTGAGFYGGLADLLATALTERTDVSPDIDIAIWLNHWHPTAGTLETGKRNTAQRLIVRDGELHPLPKPTPEREWAFAGEAGTQPVVMQAFSEIITLRHLQPTSISPWMNAAPLQGLGDPATPAPSAVDALGRSAQCFEMDVRVRTAEEERMAIATGQDIYFVTTPMVVEAAARLMVGDTSVAPKGVFSPGQLFDAKALLDAIPQDQLNVTFPSQPVRT